MICVPHSPIVKHLAKDLYKYRQYTQISHYKVGGGGGGLKKPYSLLRSNMFFQKREKIINNLLILFLELRVFLTPNRITGFNKSIFQMIRLCTGFNQPNVQFTAGAFVLSNKAFIMDPRLLLKGIFLLLLSWFRVKS